MWGFGRVPSHQAASPAATTPWKTQEASASKLCSSGHASSSGVMSDGARPLRVPRFLRKQNCTQA